MFMSRSSFIVRVYDQSEINGLKKEAELMTGIVEYAGTGIKFAFNNKDELWRFMAEHQEEVTDKYKTETKKNEFH